MATRLRRRIYHQSHPYAEGNDDQGMREAARLGMWIDRDLQMSSDGIFIGTHWAYPKREGFTLAGRRVALPFRRITFARIARLRTKNGRRIKSAGAAISLGRDLGVPGIEFELKFVPTQRMLNRLARAAKRNWGPDWQRHVQIKMLAGFNWRVGLARASRAGFTTTLINFDGKPSALPHFVDHYRR
ncbi:hypothetical protein [Nocardioides sp. WS12]|uniref:hypothetical protein n=1 Tax=Nocardioides sp. WS12 TaxID=2486272 RepID=UPI0015FB4FCA|nr:hypothetical protein [Nocardioides sp. WS12]